MTRQPDPQQPTATQAGQPIVHLDQQRIDRIANAFSAALEEVDKPTMVRVADPSIPTWQDGPRIGTTPPVVQEHAGSRPPMSQRAVDASTLMLSGSVAYAVFAGSTSVILWASHWADPKVIALLCAAPPAIAVPILAACALLKRARQVVAAAPAEIHQHYSGHVHQDNRQNHLHTDTRGLIATTRNELPPATR